MNCVPCNNLSVFNPQTLVANPNVTGNSNVLLGQHNTIGQYWQQLFRPQTGWTPGWQTGFQRYPNNSLNFTNGWQTNFQNNQRLTNNITPQNTLRNILDNGGKGTCPPTGVY